MNAALIITASMLGIMGYVAMGRLTYLAFAKWLKPEPLSMEEIGLTLGSIFWPIGLLIMGGFALGGWLFTDFVDGRKEKSPYVKDKTK